MSHKTYAVNDIFYSLQGEGIRSGIPNIFLRFAGCNLACAGTIIDQAYAPVCDTEFVSHTKMTIADILTRCRELAPQCPWIILTGGEPALQVDKELCDALHDDGYRLAIETNGTHNVDDLGLDWICVSPKVAEHAIQQRTADEVKYIRSYGQGIPKTVVQANHYLISPAFYGDNLDTKTLQWCIQLVKDNPPWQLTLQGHKLMQIR